VWAERTVVAILTFKDEAQTALFKEPVRTALSTLSTKVIKTNQFMLCKVKVVVFSVFRTKYSMQSEHQVEFFLNLNLVILKETARL